jgi:hypothetical protein
MKTLLRALALVASLSLLGACRSPISAGSGGDTDLSLAFIIQGRPKTSGRASGVRLILPTVKALKVILESTDLAQKYESSVAVDASQTLVELKFRKFPWAPTR